MELLESDNADPEALRKALLRRAMTAVKHVWQLQEEGMALQQLMRQGAVDDATWSAYKAAEADMQMEMHEVRAEAEVQKPGMYFSS